MSPTRSIVAIAFGNVLEWYDFTVYALFAGYLAQNFFPASGGSSAALLKTFLVFGFGFVARPLGAVIIGSYGDRAGRKASLTLTIWLMAGGTAIIAFAPSYASIGVYAPLLLLGGRLLQGFSAGGEIGGAAALLIENADRRRRGRIAAWLQSSMGLANIVAALVAYAVTSRLNPSEVVSWGWRIPFLLGLSIVPVGIYLRRSLETSVWPQRVRAPFRLILRDHRRSLRLGLGVGTLWAVAVYVLIVYLPTYVQRHDTFNFSAQQAFGASLIANVPFVIGCLVFGALSDRIGRRPSLALGASSLFVCVWPLLEWLQAHPTALTLVIVQSLLGVLVASFVGVAPAALAELFPIGVRSTGIAVVYNGAFTVFGGFAPSILTWFSQRSAGALYAPAWYVMLAAVVALPCILLLPHPVKLLERYA